eukprot:TRINITY_DN11698_c1_g1_i1.p1 TRINITY_DN11698_c1_g1~~TRINITY_DN11698_c1_g1_i1.p1  ORF type:complete len:538 (+),score=122.08 TRINITY_DN11698_c1_g1_i1:40-1653(+)
MAPACEVRSSVGGSNSDRRWLTAEMKDVMASLGIDGKRLSTPQDALSVLSQQSRAAECGRTRPRRTVDGGLFSVADPGCARPRRHWLRRLDTKMKDLEFFFSAAPTRLVPNPHLSLLRQPQPDFMPGPKGEPVPLAAARSDRWWSGPKPAAKQLRRRRNLAAANGRASTVASAPAAARLPAGVGQSAPDAESRAASASSRVPSRAGSVPPSAPETEPPLPLPPPPPPPAPSDPPLHAAGVSLAPRMAAHSPKLRAAVGVPELADDVHTGRRSEGRRRADSDVGSRAAALSATQNAPSTATLTAVSVSCGSAVSAVSSFRSAVAAPSPGPARSTAPCEPAPVRQRRPATAPRARVRSVVATPAAHAAAQARPAAHAAAQATPLAATPAAPAAIPPATAAPPPATPPAAPAPDAPAEGAQPMTPPARPPSPRSAPPIRPATARARASPPPSVAAAALCPQQPMQTVRPQSASVGGRRMGKDEVKQTLARLERNLSEEKERRERVYRELQDTQSKVRILGLVLSQRPRSATVRRTDGDSL